MAFVGSGWEPQAKVQTPDERRQAFYLAVQDLRVEIELRLF